MLRNAELKQIKHTLDFLVKYIQPSRHVTISRYVMMKDQIFYILPQVVFTTMHTAGFQTAQYGPRSLAHSNIIHGRSRWKQRLDTMSEFTKQVDWKYICNAIPLSLYFILIS